ncbi:PepSY domain-containing protein [Solirubrobacter sp. CPCC 204708]|uniref:PepSY domain-containing protein n=1 Tax=Solirubrobacter deserti TaxID=2282478 RepID=A0ABT4RGF3_9ACTN|nr:PepSY domain-containing protein [Solirubrobacter deserti]MBE2319644.1 PepSY domain-containing protein [Solirubrobacter deserti]MDA0137617.1 PepSY domain-containing protein [Solirubrobacter deserti]
MKKRTIAGLTATTAAVAGTAAFAVTGATAASSSDAVRAVQTASKGVSAKLYELDKERRHWEVTFADGTQKLVALDGSKVTKTRRDDRETEVDQARVSLVAALRAAAPRVGETALTDADLDSDEGQLVWQIGFADDTDVDVDARTGKVLRVDRDDD